MEGWQRIVVKINELDELFTIRQELLSKYIFRGQGCDSWKLESSLRRLVSDYHNGQYENRLPAEYEIKMMKEFMWKYPTYQANPNMMPYENDKLEWLSVMQHYGAKTRLLDFSYSLYVALYMAIYGASNTDSAVWALNVDMLKEPFLKEPKVPSTKDEFENYIYKRANYILNKVAIKDDDPDINKLFMLQPKLCNERISRQQGLFVMPSIVTRSFHDILNTYFKYDYDIVLDKTSEPDALYSLDRVGLIQFVIPNRLRYDITRALEQMNISSETMYAGVEGMAQSVNRLRENV